MVANPLPNVKFNSLAPHHKYQIRTVSYSDESFYEISKTKLPSKNVFSAIILNIMLASVTWLQLKKSAGFFLVHILRITPKAGEKTGSDMPSCEHVTESRTVWPSGRNKLLRLHNAG